MTKKIKILQIHIKNKYIRLARKILKEDALYKEKINILKKRIFELQEKCKHPSTSYEADPSGNSGSFRRCSDCGKEW